jgi:tetratricopeptide (TPR) repeat protein
MDLDPMDFKSGGNLAWMLFLARRYDDSVRELQRMIESHPSVPGFHLFLAWNYEAQGRFQEAIDELHRLEPQNPNPALPELAFIYAAMGNQQAAHAAIEKLVAESGHNYVLPYDIAVVYAGLRDNNRVFEWLEKAFKERSSFLVYLKTEPRLDGIRSDSRYTDLVRRVGFPTP